MAPHHPLSWDWLPRLSPAQEILLGKLSGWLPLREGWSLDALEPSLGFPLEIALQEIGPANRSRAPNHLSQLIRLEHAASSTSAMVAIDAPLAIELAWLCLTGNVDPSMATPRALDRVEQGALLYLAARTVWSIWGKAGPLRVAGIATPEEFALLSPESVKTHFTLRAGPCEGHAWLYLPPGVTRLIPPESQRPTSVRELWSRVDDLPTMLHVTLGRSQLSLAQLIQAKKGDALLLDEVWAWPDVGGDFSSPQCGRLRLRLPGGRPRWEGALSSQGALSITNAISANQEAVVIDPSDENLPSNPGELLGEMPVEISVELGRVALSAREVVELRPGKILRLDRSPGDPVELRLGPKLVARGELVDVGGELGVLLKEIYERGQR